MDAGFLICRGASMADTPEREEIARRYGFGSYAELLDISEALPVMQGMARCYLARRPRGNWFVWEDPTPGLPPSKEAEQ